MANRKKMMPATKVMIDKILSTPLSLVLAKMFMLLPPVMAPEAPCDFGPVSKAKIMSTIEMTNRIISYALIFCLSFYSTHPKIGYVVFIIHKIRSDTRKRFAYSLQSSYLS